MARKTAGLSERHRKIMDFLTRFQDEYGYSPSIRQIGDSIGVKSTSLVDYYLDQLQKMDYISRDDRISRSIRVQKPVEEPESVLEQVKQAAAKVGAMVSEMLNIPIHGRIVASAMLPMPPDSSVGYFDPETSVEVARSLFGPREKVSDLFALEVDGDSMIDAMVNDGDIVIMRHAESANNGEMVAVWLDNENSTTLKYYYREKDRIRLQPANPTMQPIYINKSDAEHLRIMGKVVMVIRKVKSIAA